MTDSPKKYGHWIAGAWHQPEQGHYPITDPATEEAAGYAPEGHAAEVWAADEAARAAFVEWSGTDPAERGAILERISSLVEERADVLVPLLRAESGATTPVAKAVLAAAADTFRHSARTALEPDTVPFPPRLSDGVLVNAAALRRPVGVVACLTSDNFPVTTLAGLIAPALAAGNTVVAKPSAQDPLAFLALGPITKEAGLPDGVFNIVAGSGPITGEALVAHYYTDMISFTGSAAMGKRIAVAGGEQLKPALLDVGGKGTVIVLQDADAKNVDSAVTVAASAFFRHSGQDRTAPARLLVHRSLYDKALAALTERARAAKIGGPGDDATTVGPLLSITERDRVEAYIEDAKRQGARIAAGGERPDLKPGAYAAPTVLADVTPDMTAAQEEIRGPVVVVMPFDDEDEAIRISTGTSFSRHDHVFSADTARAWQLAARLRSFMVSVNTAERHPEVCFGGSLRIPEYSTCGSVVWPS